jgi:hypothetical protein
MCAFSDDPAKASVVLDREPDQDRSLDPSGPASAARSAAGRPAKKTDGLVAAVMTGTRSIPGASALPASSGGLTPSASRAPAGRRIRIGMRSNSRSLSVERFTD